MKNLLNLSVEFKDYFFTFRESLVKLGNYENDCLDLIQSTVAWCPSYSLKGDKKKDKGLNLKMISLNVSKIQELCLHQKHHTDAIFLRHIFRTYFFLKTIYFDLKKFYNSCT